MKKQASLQQTTVGAVSPDALAYTAGRDAGLDAELVAADCIGTAAHVVMLTDLPLNPRLFSPRDRDRVVAALAGILRRAQNGQFQITLNDQDVHMAVERELTRQLGALGRKVHTGRSRNDQVAVDLRLYAREQLLGALQETLQLARALLKLARRHQRTPMVGRTHLQPAMPSSVGLWASAYAEGLLDDTKLLESACALNDLCPLGSAAGYGVPLPLDRQRVSDLLGFRRPIHNVLHAANSRGKHESIILGALGQVMITLSRLAEDLILFAMPEFGYFKLPPEMGTGSSIMPQKNNPDVLELMRARAARVLSWQQTVLEVVRALPGGYQRDLQETKEPFLRGFEVTRASLRIMTPMINGLQVNRDALCKAFSPAVFATDAALELVAGGMPFRDAYQSVKDNLNSLAGLDPREALALKTHAGAPAGLDLTGLARRTAAISNRTNAAARRHSRIITKLLRAAYPPPG